MGKMTWRVGFTKENPDHLTVEMREDDRPLGHVSMLASEVEGLIDQLATFRARMKPEVSRISPSGDVYGLHNPLFATLSLPVLPGRLLSIRHDGFGWLSFAFPQDTADKIADGLSSRRAESETLDDPTRLRH